MKNKILLISLIAALSLSAVSCGSKDSSSESKNTDSSSVSTTENAEPDEDTGTTAAETETEAPTETASENGSEMPADDDLFTYDLPECAVENPDGHNKYLDNKYYDLGENAYIITYQMMVQHQSAHYAGNSIMERYMADEEIKYTDVAGSDLEINGVPAYKFTAKFKENNVDCDCTSVFLQYGNGDIFALVYAYPSAEKDKYEPICEEVISSVKYTGAPLKTEDEQYSSDICSMTVNKDFYIDEENGGVSLKLNIYDKTEELVSRITVRPAKSTAEELKIEYEEDADKYNSIEAGQADIGNYNANYVKVTGTAMNMPVEQCSYFVDTPNGSYEILVMSSEDMYDEFMERAKPIFDSLVLGK